MGRDLSWRSENSDSGYELFCGGGMACFLMAGFSVSASAFSALIDSSDRLNKAVKTKTLSFNITGTFPLFEINADPSR